MKKLRKWETEYSLTVHDLAKGHNDLVEAVQELQEEHTKLKEAYHRHLLPIVDLDKELDRLGEKGLINATTVERGKAPEKSYTLNELDDLSGEWWEKSTGNLTLTQAAGAKYFLKWLEQEDR